MRVVMYPPKDGQHDGWFGPLLSGAQQFAIEHPTKPHRRRQVIEQQGRRLIAWWEGDNIVAIHIDGTR